MAKYTSTGRPTGDGKGQPPPWSNVYDHEKTRDVINSQPLLHLTFPTQDEEFPTVAYLVGKFFKYKNKPEALYAHGHLQEPIKYRLETDREVRGPGLPVTIGASKINSYVLGYSGFATGYTWTSTAVNGIAHLLPVSEDFKEERLAVVNNILEGFIPERSTHIRPIGDDLKYISIIRIDVNEKRSHTHGIPAALGFELKTDVEDKAVVDNFLDLLLGGRDSCLAGIWCSDGGRS
ncbi:uncharacterized protein TRUGW13939_04816 [Talaromyces rugulosus]|uniref:Uncharacterized protein n=1 Tax=Talaromyces rugulosus TaxID=121627 RepID=A0A7H8QVD6_TALRU|nr:uncharacterized protein TRUGW13939_04816 [Talaromyces rugulosus]QKX57698.1 hypothetical protein TRUGW13939_04816 [Talaromyces rugulosus]